MRLKPNQGVLFLCLLWLYIGQTCGVSLEIVQKDETHHEARSENIQTGTITFGTGNISLGRNLDYERRYVGENTTDDGSVNVQADDPGLVGGQSGTHDFRAWDRMRPKLLCTNDLMKFSAQGPGCSSLQLDSGGTPLSLHQLRRECGYSVKRTAVGLVLLATFDGCDVIKQGNSHLLQMLWHGNPVTLSCPASSSDQASLVVSTTPAPTTEAPSTAAELPPQNQQWMNPLFGGYYPVMPVNIPPQTTEAPTTAAEPPPQNQQWMNPLFGGYYPVMPVNIPPQTTEAPTTAAEPPPQNQQWMNPLFGGYYPVMPVNIPPQTTEAPTTAAEPPPQNQQWMNPLFGGYYPVMPVNIPPQTTEAPTTAAEPPPQNQQWMNPFFGGYYPVMPVNIPPQTTEAPTTAAELPPQNQQWMHRRSRGHWGHGSKGCWRHP
ncbi:leucine-rich repeat extensin-like protein 2 [Alosa sapidissima]|uniref:leucine-rich repeat extensin-like protein 2 n=1 Tax=Alosa sapidissima TaxID=34773 RepID=UPI001C081174|nr:leucine-rich repeat extensin-like protein 2 [Alosa sapidissima]